MVADGSCGGEFWTKAGWTKCFLSGNTIRRKNRTKNPCDHLRIVQCFCVFFFYLFQKISNQSHGKYVELLYLTTQISNQSHGSVCFRVFFFFFWPFNFLWILSFRVLHIQLVIFFPPFFFISFHLFCFNFCSSFFFPSNWCQNG